MRLRIALLMIAIAGPATSQTQPSLQLQGQPYFGGNMTLHLTGAVGQPALVAFGLDPLTTPIQTGKGPWYIGSLVNLVPLGSVPASGRIDVAFTMPPLMPAFIGIPIALQGYIPPALTNPATLGLDEPYLLARGVTVIENPLPSEQALFGDSIAAGDFNGDGAVDLAVGAWFEDVAGADKAGCVYVMWGPGFSAFTRLEPTAPVLNLHFGLGLVAADFDGDGVADLGVGQGTGGDPPLNSHAFFVIYQGSANFPSAPSVTATSAGTGQSAYIFGRIVRAGDLNDDGWPDLAVGAPDAMVNGLDRAGRIEVFYGPSLDAPLLIENPEPKVNDFFGSRLSLCDMTGDGVTDIVEASGRAKVGTISQAGRVHLYDGPTLSLLKTIDNPAPAANDRFGEGLTAADLEGDGQSEIVVADVKKNVYVVWNSMSATTISTSSKPPTPNPTSAATSFGYFFATSDANGDGLTDIVIADPFEGDVTGCGVLSAGGSIYFALAPYFSTYLRLSNPMGACGDEFSWNLVAVDLDGDLVEEFVAGDDTADVGGVSNAGCVILVTRY
jgi:hypothetical protein